MFKKQNKKSPAVEQSDVPGWTGEWSEVALCLRDGGGRPEPWGEAVKDGSLAAALPALKEIVVPLKSPLGGVQRRAWFCASAWRVSQEKCKKLTDEKEQLETQLSLARQEVMKIQAEKEALNQCLNKALVGLAQTQRQMRRRPPRRTDPAKVRTVAARVREDASWDPMKWDEDVWDEAEGLDWYQAKPVTRRRQTENMGPTAPVQAVNGLGDLMFDANGQPIMVQPRSPAAHFQRITEDYTAEELSHLGKKI